MLFVVHGSLSLKTDELAFFTGIINYVREVALYKPKLNIYSDADSNAYVPFLMATHQPGNGVIGDRVSLDDVNLGEHLLPQGPSVLDRPSVLALPF